MSKDVSNRRAKVYDKYVVARSVGGRSVKKNNDGSPVLGEKVKTNIIVTEDLAETLNFGWDSTEMALTYFYKEVVKEDTNNEKELLLAEAKELGLDVDGRTGLEKLKQLINESKS